MECLIVALFLIWVTFILRISGSLFNLGLGFLYVLSLFLKYSNNIVPAFYWLLLTGGDENILVCPALPTSEVLQDVLASIKPKMLNALHEKSFLPNLHRELDEKSKYMRLTTSFPTIRVLAFLTHSKKK